MDAWEMLSYARSFGQISDMHAWPNLVLLRRLNTAYRTVMTRLQIHLAPRLQKDYSTELTDTDSLTLPADCNTVLALFRGEETIGGTVLRPATEVPVTLRHLIDKHPFYLATEHFPLFVLERRVAEVSPDFDSKGTSVKLLYLRSLPPMLYGEFVAPAAGFQFDMFAPNILNAYKDHTVVIYTEDASNGIWGVYGEFKITSYSTTRLARAVNDALAEGSRYRYATVPFCEEELHNLIAMTFVIGLPIDEADIVKLNKQIEDTTQTTLAATVGGD